MRNVAAPYMTRCTDRDAAALEVKIKNAAQLDFITNLADWRKMSAIRAISKLLAMCREHARRHFVALRTPDV